MINTLIKIVIILSVCLSMGGCGTPPATVPGVVDEAPSMEVTPLTAADLHTVTYLPAGRYSIAKDIITPSDTEIYGDGDSTIITIEGDNITGFSTGTTADKKDIKIHDLKIVGGGQTTDIYSGRKGNVGIMIARATNVAIDRVTISKMGIINKADVTNDKGFSGMGILITARYGALTNIKVNNCNVSQVAGGGMNSGDGIYVAGYNKDLTTATTDVVISNNIVSQCGRHCYTVAGGSGGSIPDGVKFVNNQAYYSALSGLDIEDGYNTAIQDSAFWYCGNDQTYYNPAAIYGKTYRLIAGVATSNTSKNTSITGSKFYGCYVGVAYSYDNGLLIDSSKFEASILSDITMGSANTGAGMKLINSQFLTNLPVLNFYRNAAVAADFLAEDCMFTGEVKIFLMSDGTFRRCTFKTGIWLNTATKLMPIVFDNCVGL
ncbi:MAG: hypothetical protein M0Z78_08985 [Betaproteobacteria bacterium]|nr:hypothetical protein [Betaproteobacteria bacterium]